MEKPNHKYTWADVLDTCTAFGAVVLVFIAICYLLWTLFSTQSRVEDLEYRIQYLEERQDTMATTGDTIQYYSYKTHEYEISTP